MSVSSFKHRAQNLLLQWISEPLPGFSEKLLHARLKEPTLFFLLPSYGIFIQALEASGSISSSMSKRLMLLGGWSRLFFGCLLGRARVLG